jgi:hypothetical protein
LDHSFWIRPGPRLGFWVLTRSSELFFLKSKRRRFSKIKKSAIATGFLTESYRVAGSTRQVISSFFFPCFFSIRSSSSLESIYQAELDFKTMFQVTSF